MRRSGFQNLSFSDRAMKVMLPFAALTAAVLLTGPALAATPAAKCELDRPVMFAGLDYDSAQFHNAVKFIIARWLRR
jgi:ABC-type proline/glycine betaine transport system substrate-binding protein